MARSERQLELVGQRGRNRAISRLKLSDCVPANIDATRHDWTPDTVEEEQKKNGKFFGRYISAANVVKYFIRVSRHVIKG